MRWTHLRRAVIHRLPPSRGPRRTLAAPPARVLIMQADGMHKGQDGWTPNWFLRECHALRHGFQSLGIHADVWGKGHAHFERQPDFESYDFLLCAENDDFHWLPNLGRIVRPLKAHWIIDLHCRPPATYSRLTSWCDVALHATRSLLDGYERLHPNQRHVWFANAVDDRYFDTGKRRRDRTRDVLFVGTDLPARRSFLRDLERRVGLESRFATGEDMLDLVASSRIHVNRNIGVDINFRTFETIGLGTCLVTDANPDLERLGFQDGVNCLLYRSADEAVDKIRWALAGGHWEPIGAAGYELSRRHTYTRRIEALLAQLLNRGVPGVDGRGGL